VKLTTPSFFISTLSSFARYIIGDTPEAVFLLSSRYPFFAAIYTTVAKENFSSCIYFSAVLFRASRQSAMGNWKAQESRAVVNVTNDLTSPYSLPPHSSPENREISKLLFHLIYGPQK
jgi:hypothetical protein